MSVIEQVRYKRWCELFNNPEDATIITALKNKEDFIVFTKTGVYSMFPDGHVAEVKFKEMN